MGTTRVEGVDGRCIGLNRRAAVTTGDAEVAGGVGTGTEEVIDVELGPWLNRLCFGDGHGVLDALKLGRRLDACLLGGEVSRRERGIQVSGLNVGTCSVVERVRSDAEARRTRDLVRRLETGAP